MVVIAAAYAAPAPEDVSRSIRQTASQVLAIAKRAEALGQTETAEKAYEALAQDEKWQVRAEALYRHASLAAAKGEWRKAALLLRRLVDHHPDTANARIALARVLTEIGDESAALRELRAAQAIGLPPEVARMIDRFSEALRVRRPFGASLEVAVAPDSNINTATTRDTVGTVVGDFEIDPSGKAKSGVGAAFRGSVYARQALANRLVLLGRASVNADLYRNTRFSQVAMDLAAGPEVHLGPIRVNLETGATRRWFGLKPFEDSLRLEANAAIPAGRRSLARLRLGVAKIDNKLNDLQDGQLWSGEIGLERALTSRSGVGVTLWGSRARLSDPGYSTTAWRATLLGWHEFGRATAHASASFGRLEADERLSLFQDKRNDRSWRLNAGATMRQLQVGGFAPFMRLSIERNESSIAFYDYRRRRVEFGFVRAF